MAEKEKKEYTFKGAVKVYDRVVASFYKASTYAVSAAKARSNMAYQYKRNNGLADHVKVSLEGELVAL